jgi:cardiolipin synthase
VQHLCAAAKRGVDVSIIIPNRNDNPLLKLSERSNYPELLKSGVKVYEYVGPDPQKPIMSHGKVAVFDDHMSTVGSTNLDARSLRNNDEANIWVKDPKLAQTITKDLFEKDFKVSKAVTTYTPGPIQRLEDKMIKNFSNQM